MSVHWVIQRNLRNSFEAERLSEVISALGHHVHMVELTPFSALVPEVPAIPAEALVVCHGPGFIPRMLGHPTWRPGVFFDDASFRWSACRANWPDLMINKAAKISTVGEVCALLGEGDRMFVRPDSDNKAFESGIHDARTFAQAVALSNMPDGSRADDTVAVVVGVPIEIVSEYRLFVVDGEVVAASSYRHLRRPNFEAFVPNHVVDVALTAASQWMPAPAACIDVAICADGSTGIVEANCVNAARFYGANISAVIDAISSYVER